jgi:hypothetical protein
MQRVNVNGVEIFPFSSQEQLLDYIEQHCSILVAINAEKIMHATSITRKIINSNIGYCDGVGAVMALKQKGHANVCKIAGCELWLAITAKYYKNKTFYLIGSTQDVIENTIAKLKQEFHGINIVGFRNGYLKSQQEKEELIAHVIKTKPDIVFVAMGSPKQELLMQEMQQQHSAIYQGLGGSFNVYTGQTQRAPEWWLKHNLEFAYRFLKEPQRLKRQIPILRLAIKLLLHRI